MNPQGPKALHRQLADEVRRQIREGTLPAGTKLPSESELREQHNVSRTTARLALGLLRTQGLIATERGRGSFVTDPDSAPPALNATDVHVRSRRELYPDLDAWRTDLALQGIRTGRVDVSVQVMPPPAEIADRLGLEEGAEVVARQRIESVGEKPLAISTSYFPAEMVADTELLQPTDILRGTNRIMAELGHEAVRRTDEIRPRMPTTEEAELLQLEAWQPVLVATHTERDSTDTPVEVHVIVTHRQVQVYEVDLEG